MSHRSTLTLVTDAASEPVTVPDQKTWMREDLDNADNDLLINKLITAGRKLIGKDVGYIFLNESWRLTLDAFPTGSDPLEFWKFPLSSVTQIQYIDSDGATQTWSDALYDVDTDSKPGRVAPVFGEVYPVTRDVQNAVTATFVAGYGTTAADVPDDLLSAIKSVVTDMYENRETLSKLPKEVRAFLSPGFVIA